MRVFFRRLPLYFRFWKPNLWIANAAEPRLGGANRVVAGSARGRPGPLRGHRCLVLGSLPRRIGAVELGETEEFPMNYEANLRLFVFLKSRLSRMKYVLLSRDVDRILFSCHDFQDDRRMRPKSKKKKSRQPGVYRMHHNVYKS